MRPPYTRVFFHTRARESGAARDARRPARAWRRRRWVEKNIAHPFAPRAGASGVRASSTAVECASDADVAKGCGARVGIGCRAYRIVDVVVAACETGIGDMYSCARVMGVGVGGGAVSAARGASMGVDKMTPAMTMMGWGRRRGARVAMGAKKAKRGGGNQDDYSSDFALYGSFDEDYGEGAGLLLGKQELRGGAGVGRGKKKAGYDAVAGVLDALANERKARRSSSPAPASGGGVGYAKKSAAYDVDDEETGAESNGDDFVAAPAAKAAAPKPKLKPKPVAKPKQVEDVDPVSTTAKAAKTLQKWGFVDADVTAALDAVSASVGDGATAKKRQVAALDWLLANCEFDRVPDEYKLEAQQARAQN